MRLNCLIQISGVTSAVLILSGCGISFVADRKTNPTIQDAFASTSVWDYVKWDNPAVNTFSVTASRRSILVRKDSAGQFMTCAEPPPDVGEAFASAIADGLTLAATEPKSQVRVEVANQYAKAVATQIAPLVHRTQGLQFYRDSLHDLCIDRLNGWVADQATYYAQKQDLRSMAAQLITEELRTMEKSQAIFYQFVRAGIAVDDLARLQKLINSSDKPSKPVGQPSGDTGEDPAANKNKKDSTPSNPRSGQGP